MSFSDLGLMPELLRAVAEKGYSAPTPIQQAAIPAVLAGRDVLAGAQTGTGKTAAFVLPLLQRLSTPAGRAPRALVLTPTRELAAQVAESAADYGRYSPVRTTVIFGGVSDKPQIAALRHGCDLLVATPGRLQDLAQQRQLDLSQVQFCVLDEADRMLDIGFRPDIERILRKLPSPRQTFLLSATINADVRKLALRYMYQPIEVNLSQDEISVETIKQYYIPVSGEQKLDLLLLLLKRDRPRQCIVFTRTRRGADRLADRLHRVVKGVSAIHGDLPQSTRDRVMRGFRSGQISVLVATDVVGRGIDVEGISHVINYDMPDDPENYVHRIGRTGRMGKDGVAYLFVCPDQGDPLTAIENLVNKVIPALEVEGFSQSRKRVEPVARELFNTAITRSFSMATR
jgi:ATP-dependent RNA helicase DeaD